ncbi:MAG TPA: hypothetical protein VLT35_06665, partial [Methanocella sp.]|nr:hypothetical protein [Methanocella sp.]
MEMQFDTGRAERSSRILDSLPEPVFFFDDAGELVYINRAGEGLIDGRDRPIWFCDVVDCGASGYREVVDGIRRGALAGSLHSHLKPGSGDSGSLLDVVPVDGGVICKPAHLPAEATEPCARVEKDRAREAQKHA